ncbi:MAG TPA: flippase-like domain-containing protein, partial [Magnetococcales bacterium]|nr:flippase-like domain-containing protein [Magnetococcales bacterium]
AGYYFYYCAIGLLSNSVIPQVGNYFLKARSLKNEFNVPTATSLQSVYQEQVFDLIILITIIGPSFLFFFKLTSVAMTRILYLFIVLAVVMLTLRSKRSIFQWINGVLVLLARFLSIFPVLRERFASAQALFNLPPPPNKTCLWLYFNSIIKYSIISARIYIVMVAIGIDFSYWHIFFGTPMIQIILLLGVTFGGIGASDAGWFFFLFSFGVDKNDIGNFLILERILSLGALSFVTFSSYLYYRAQVAYGTVRDGQTP